MNVPIFSLFLTLFLFFSQAVYSYGYLANKANVPLSRIDKIRELCNLFELPIELKNEKDLQKYWAQWISKKENQNRLLAEIYESTLAGGLDQSEDMMLMLNTLVRSLERWNNTYYFKLPNELKLESQVRIFKPIQCSFEEFSEDKLAAQIQALRDEEEARKQKSFELILQATGEAMGAGVSAASGIEVLAVYEGCQSARHFVQGCNEYNEAVRCQQEADALQNQYMKNENESEQRSWWEFWK
jgi:hypothetical protein